MAFKKFSLRFGDWIRTSSSKMGMSNEAAFAIFVCTQQVVTIPGEPKLKNMESAVSYTFLNQLHHNCF
jgi:hypothetical protein